MDGGSAVDCDPAGIWYAPCGDFGIVDDSRVDPKLLRRLFDAKTEDAASLLSESRRGASRIPAYDITFSVPRSVSLVWALSTPDVSQQIEQALSRAVRAALGLLEREAIFARRGSAGKLIEPVPLTAAQYRHGESRPSLHDDGRIFADPHLHIHCVIPNIATRADGTIGALYSMPQRNMKLCVGAYMHAALAFELQTLGFDVDRFRPNGLFEIKGVEQDHIDYFSARKREIQEELEKQGINEQNDPRATVAAANRTKRPKDNIFSHSRRRFWSDVASARGIKIANFAEALQRVDATFYQHGSEELLHRRVSDLVEKFSERQSIVGRKDLLRGIAACLVGTALPTSRVDIEVQRLHAGHLLIEIGRDKLGLTLYGARLARQQNSAVKVSENASSSREQSTRGEETIRLRCEEAELATDDGADLDASTEIGTLRSSADSQRLLQPQMEFGYTQYRIDDVEGIPSPPPPAERPSSHDELTHVFLERTLDQALCQKSISTVKEIFSLPKHEAAEIISRICIQAGGGSLLVLLIETMAHLVASKLPLDNDRILFNLVRTLPHTTTYADVYNFRSELALLSIGSNSHSAMFRGTPLAVADVRTAETNSGLEADHHQSDES